jgi:hypothetical protein
MPPVCTAKKPPTMFFAVLFAMITTTFMALFAFLAFAKPGPAITISVSLSPPQSPLVLYTFITPTIMTIVIRSTFGFYM